MAFKKKEEKAAAPKVTAVKSNVDYKKEIASQKSQVLSLKKELSLLKKQIDSLQSQCHACCADLAELKAYKTTESRDSRVDELISKILRSPNFNSLRKFYK